MRKALLALALAASSLAVVAPARAKILDYSDVAGDRMTETMTQSGITHQRGGDEGDITFVRVSHTDTQVLVYLRFRKLSVPQQYAGVFFVLEGNNGIARRIVIKTSHGNPQGGAATVYKGEGPSLTEVHCATSHRFIYRNDSLSVRLARGCLRKPKYVRMRGAFGSSRFNDTFSRESWDDPNRDGGTQAQLGTARSPWVVTG
jgi:hypothetical protein